MIEDARPAAKRGGRRRCRSSRPCWRRRCARPSAARSARRAFRRRSSCWPVPLRRQKRLAPHSRQNPRSRPSVTYQPRPRSWSSADRRSRPPCTRRRARGCGGAGAVAVHDAAERAARLVAHRAAQAAARRVGGWLAHPVQYREEPEEESECAVAPARRNAQRTAGGDRGFPGGRHRSAERPLTPFMAAPRDRRARSSSRWLHARPDAAHVDRVHTIEVPGRLIGCVGRDQDRSA